MQKWHHKQSKKYISKISVGFVKCHEWRVACNRPTLACPRIIAAATAFEVALQVASVARSVFMTSQLYRRLAALSVLSGYCGVVNTCWLPPVIRYDTILMLFRSTSPSGLGDRASPPPVRLSVSDLPPPSSPMGLMGHVWSILPFLQTNITSQMWPSGGKGNFWQGGYDQSDLPCHHFVESYCQLILLKNWLLSTLLSTVVSAMYACIRNTNVCFFAMCAWRSSWSTF